MKFAIQTPVTAAHKIADILVHIKLNSDSLYFHVAYFRIVLLAATDT
jgi:hypothetical protein